MVSTAGSDLSIPFGVGIGTLSSAGKNRKQVVKASAGHFPQPFLISDDKELAQK
jgi:hypothetical protein